MAHFSCCCRCCCNSACGGCSVENFGGTPALRPTSGGGGGRISAYVCAYNQADRHLVSFLCSQSRGASTRCLRARELLPAPLTCLVTRGPVLRRRVATSKTLRPGRSDELALFVFYGRSPCPQKTTQHRRWPERHSGLMSQWVYGLRRIWCHLCIQAR